MDTIPIDWTPVTSSPLFKSAALIFCLAVLAWFITEALSYVVPSKWRPLVAVLFGVGAGAALDYTTLLDFGSGPNGRARALVLGFLGGVGAVVGHPLVRDRWPWNILTSRTPSAPKPAPAEEPKP